MPVQLSKREEGLLKEILEHRDINGFCDSDYWKHRFDDSIISHDEDVILRGTFEKLRHKGLIDTLWADDFPCEIEVLDDGLTYFDEQERVVDMSERPTVFISYQQSSGSDFVDDLEHVLTGKAEILRDKHLEAGSDLLNYMESIRDQDFAVLVITDGYLKSAACMLEVTHFMRERNWKDRVMFAVLDDSIYSRKDEYLRYWDTRKNELNEKRKSDDTGTTELISIVAELDKISKFSAELNDFLTTLFAKKNSKVWMILIDIISRIEQSTSFSIIPPELLQQSIDTRARQSMTDIAADLLIRAAKDQSPIICIQDMSGWFIGTKSDHEIHFTDAVQIAELREAVEQLETLRFIRSEGKKREVFTVTAEGYRIANQIEIDQLLD